MDTYEAGVAKGKLDKTVLGIAIGISLNAATSGPFAQFQNNDGDVDSITKLVLDLVRKVPELDPDQNLVKGLVEEFHKKADEIVQKLSPANAGEETKKIDDNSTAKLFEEVKIMFDSLPSKIESRLDPESKRRRHFHPRVFDEIVGTTLNSGNSDQSFLLAISFFKEDFPWLYEVGLETYRGLKSSKSSSNKEELISSFLELLDRNGSSRAVESKDAYFLFQEIKHFLEYYFNNYYKKRNKIGLFTT